MQKGVHRNLLFNTMQLLNFNVHYNKSHDTFENYICSDNR